MAAAPPITSIWARCAFIGLALFWGAAGWAVVIERGFHSTLKRSTHTVFVDGAGAVLMAAVFLLLATLSAAVVLQSLRARRAAYVGLVLFAFVPPCAYALLV